MINLILFGSFFVMLLLNIPIAVSLGMSSIFALLFSSSPLTVVPTNVYSGMAKFLLLAIPFFVLSGNIMAKAGISSRLVAFADDCVGHRRGGIAIVAVIVACFFGAISGSGPATVAALGIILIPAMINRGGFSAPFASSLMASASSIAIVIPPSIAFVVYASITGVSVGDMFMGGWIPGIMLIVGLCITNSIMCRHFDSADTTKYPPKEYLIRFKDAILALQVTPEERELCRRLGQLPDEIVAAAKYYDPARMTRYAMEVAALYHKFYQNCRVKCEDHAVCAARAALCRATATVLENTLAMLKITAPEVM